MAAQRQRSRETKHLPIASIVLTPGLRCLKDDAVASLAESMSRVGQIVPITVNLDYRAENPDEVMPAGATKYYVISGRHRLAAAVKLGWTTIECFVDYDADEVRAELWEIAENLHRAELSSLEKSEQIERWRALTAIEGGNISSPSGGHQPHEAGVKKTARELGVDPAEVRAARHIASLSEEAKEAARKSGLDSNRSALLEASKAEPQRQAAVIRDMAEAKSSGRNKIDRDVAERAIREAASIIIEHVPAEFWDGLKANLYTGKCGPLANEIANITGQSVMDRSFG